MPTLSDRLIQLKTEENLLQQNIAKDNDIPLRTYQRYERGESEPTSSTIIKLADYFGVSVDFLLGRSDEPTPTGNEIFARRLTESRKEKNVTEEDVAEYLDIPVALYCKYESAILEPNIPMLNKLAEYFKTSVDYLVGYNPNEYM